MKRRKGYSLAEVLMAIAVIGIGLVAVAGTLPVGLSYLRVVSDRWNAIQLAQAKMEDAKNISYSNLSFYARNNLKWVSDSWDPNFPLQGLDPNTWTNKSYRFAIEPIEESGISEHVIRLKVEVYWTEQNAYGVIKSQKNFVLEGYKGEQGVTN